MPETTVEQRDEMAFNTYVDVGQSYAEAARQMGVSPQRVRLRVKRHNQRTALANAAARAEQRGTSPGAIDQRVRDELAGVDVDEVMSRQRKIVKLPGRSLTERQARQAAENLIGDLASFYGSERRSPEMMIYPSAHTEPGFEAAVKDGRIEVTDRWLSKARDKDDGLFAFRQASHEAAHAELSGTERVLPGISHVVEEGGAEVLSLHHWNQRMQPFAYADSVRRPGLRQSDPQQSLAASVVYHDKVSEVLRRSASRVGGWDRDAIVADVLQAYRGDHNARLAYRDSSNPNYPVPEGYTDDGESLAAWLVGAQPLPQRTIDRGLPEGFEPIDPIKNQQNRAYVDDLLSRESVEEPDPYPIHFSVVADDALGNGYDHAVEQGFATVQPGAWEGQRIFTPVAPITESELEDWVYQSAADQLPSLLDGYGYDRDGNLYDFNQSSEDLDVSARSFLDFAQSLNDQNVSAQSLMDATDELSAAEVAGDEMELARAYNAVHDALDEIEVGPRTPNLGPQLDAYQAAIRHRQAELPVPYRTLYHGTSPDKIEGIRTEGLRPPPGVMPSQWYMLTDSLEQARRYGQGAVIEYRVPENATNYRDPEGVLWPGAEHNAYDYEATAYGVKDRVPGEYVHEVHLDERPPNPKIQAKADRSREMLEAEPWWASNEDLAAGRVPGIRIDPTIGKGLSGHKYDESGDTVLSPKFLDDTPFGRYLLLSHEVGHDVAAHLLRNDAGEVLGELREGEGRWNFKNPWGLNDGPSEILADGYSELLTFGIEDEDSDYPPTVIKKRIREAARQLGLPDGPIARPQPNDPPRAPDAPEPSGAVGDTTGAQDDTAERDAAITADYPGNGIEFVSEKYGVTPAEAHEAMRRHTLAQQAAGQEKLQQREEWEASRPPVDQIAAQEVRVGDIVRHGNTDYRVTRSESTDMGRWWRIVADPIDRDPTAVGPGQPLYVSAISPDQTWQRVQTVAESAEPIASKPALTLKQAYDRGWNAAFRPNKNRDLGASEEAFENKYGPELGNAFSDGWVDHVADLPRYATLKPKARDADDRKYEFDLGDDVTADFHGTPIQGKIVKGGARFVEIWDPQRQELFKPVRVDNVSHDRQLTDSDRTTVDIVDRQRAETIEELRSQIEQRLGVELRAKERNDDLIELDMIRVPEESRREGKGRQAMQELLAWADERGMAVSLTPDPVGSKGLSRSALTQWYRGFGFKPNKGRNKDFRTMGAMIRPPQEVNR